MCASKEQTGDHVLFKRIKLEKERELFKNNMMVKHRKWTFDKIKLVKDYTQEFVAYLNSIDLNTLQILSYIKG